MIKYKQLIEKISKTQLDTVEKFADKLFSKLGIDVEFSNHFLDRLNDSRNGKDISTAELVKLFKNLHKKHGKPVAKMSRGDQAVITDLSTSINIPFVINFKKGEMELMSKTVMRKADFKTSNKKLEV